MSNMSSVIKQHNFKTYRLCNCRNKGSCPLDGNCLQTCIFTRLMKNLNIGRTITQIHFVIDIRNKTRNFQKISGNYKSKSSISIQNRISQLCLEIQYGSRRCDLYLTEKYRIARAEQKNLLNKRTDLISSHVL